MGGGVLSLFLLFYVGAIPLIENVNRMEEEILMKQRVVQKYDQFLRSRKTIEEDLQRANKQYEEIQKRLLPGETPQLGAAALQETVGKIAEKNGISIRSFKIMEPKELLPYRRVSVQIEINPVNQILSLGKFLYDLEHQEKFLMVSEMNLIIFNIRLPNTIQGNMVVSGLMAGARGKKEGG